MWVGVYPWMGWIVVPLLRCKRTHLCTYLFTYVCMYVHGHPSPTPTTSTCIIMCGHIHNHNTCWPPVSTPITTEQVLAATARSGSIDIKGAHDMDRFFRVLLHKFRSEGLWREALVRVGTCMSVCEEERIAHSLITHTHFTHTFHTHFTHKHTDRDTHSSHSYTRLCTRALLQNYTHFTHTQPHRTCCT